MNTTAHTRAVRMKDTQFRYLTAPAAVLGSKKWSAKVHPGQLEMDIDDTSGGSAYRLYSGYASATAKEAERAAAKPVPKGASRYAKKYAKIAAGIARHGAAELAKFIAQHPEYA